MNIGFSQTQFYDEKVHGRAWQSSAPVDDSTGEISGSSLAQRPPFGYVRVYGSSPRGERIVLDRIH